MSTPSYPIFTQAKKPPSPPSSPDSRPVKKRKAPEPSLSESDDDDAPETSRITSKYTGFDTGVVMVFHNIDFFHKLVSGITDLMTAEAIIVFYEDSVYIQAMSASRVSILEASIDRRDMCEYECKNSFEICINMTSLTTQLKYMAFCDQEVIIDMTNESSDFMYFWSKDKKTKSKMNVLQNVDNIELMPVPKDQPYMHNLIVYVHMFKQQFDMLLGVTNAEIHFELREEYMKVIITNTYGENEAIYDVTDSEVFDSNPKTGLYTAMDTDNSYTIGLSVAYLMRTMKFCGISQKITIFFRESFVSCFHIDMMKHSHVNIFIAPKIEAD